MGRPCAFGGPVDRPVLPAAERQFGHATSSRTWTKRGSGGDAVDFLGGQVGAVRRDDDGRAQAGVAIQPLGLDPVVDGAAEGGGQVLAEHHLGAVDDVADGVAWVQAVEQVGLQRLQAAAGRAGRQAPVGAAVDRGVGGVAAGFEVLAFQAAAQDVLAPVVVEVWQQGAGGRDGWMDVAVDGAGQMFSSRTIHGRCFGLHFGL